MEIKDSSKVEHFITQFVHRLGEFLDKKSDIYNINGCEDDEKVDIETMRKWMYRRSLMRWDIFRRRGKINKLKVSKYARTGILVIGTVLVVSMSYTLWYMLNRLYVIDKSGFANMSLGVIFTSVILITVVEMYHEWKDKEVNKK